MYSILCTAPSSVVVPVAALPLGRACIGTDWRINKPLPRISEGSAAVPSEEVESESSESESVESSSSLSSPFANLMRGKDAERDWSRCDMSSKLMAKGSEGSSDMDAVCVGVLTSDSEGVGGCRF